MGSNSGTAPAVAGTLTWTEVYADFVTSKRNARRKPDTIEFYGHTAGRFARWLDQQGITPTTIDNRSLRRFQAEQEARGLADRTMHAFARGMSALLTFAARERYIAPGVVHVEKPRLPKDEPSRLKNAEDRARLLSACDGGVLAARDRALVLMALDSGLRRGELARLEWRDIEWRPAEAMGRVHVRQGKGGKDRTAFVFAEAWEALDVIREVQTRTGGQTLSHRPWVFISETGGQLAPHGLSEIFARLSHRAGTRLTCHMLRHTAIRSWIARGVPVTAAQKAAGHSSLAITQRYAEIDGDEVAGAFVEAFGRVAPKRRAA